MKKSEENRYPNSAELFKFCKEALIIKHHHEVKVIDQHVGAILGFDPADCSHWKKGKKNIKSIQTVNTIAQHLGMDARMVTDLVSGRMPLEECLQEYRGYGAYEISPKQQEEMKREFFRNPSKFVGEAVGVTFETIVDLKRDLSLQATEEILKASEVKSCPVMLPELVIPAHFGGTLRLNPQGNEIPEGAAFETQWDETEHWTLVVNRTHSRPHTRSLVARELGKLVLGLSKGTEELDEIHCARVNHFAGLLLVPGSLLQRVCRQLPPSSDIVAEMASIFWVGRSVMNARLKDFLQNGN